MTGAGNAAAASLPTAGILRSMELYHAEPIDRIRAIKEGVSAFEAEGFLLRFGKGRKAISRALGLKPRTISKAARTSGVLGLGASERLIGLSRLVGQVEAMLVGADGAEDFDVCAWLSEWLRQPLPVFGGRVPAEFLDTMEGRTLVSRALEQLAGHAYI